MLLTPALPSPADAASNLKPVPALATALRSSQRTAFTTPGTSPASPPRPCPAGFTDDGLPLAVQLVALPGTGTHCCSASPAQLQRAFDWTARRPAL